MPLDYYVYILWIIDNYLNIINKNQWKKQLFRSFLTPIHLEIFHVLLNTENMHFLSILFHTGLQSG
jgi:hypothetical protein